MAKKILILTASPLRDKPIDDLMSQKLTAMGNEVFVRPCLREGRTAILELQPDIVVVPPIRNPFSRDFAEVIKHFGCACVSRHTEPSCDWADFKRMDDKQKQMILGQYPYIVNVEIVWGPDEQDMLSRRGGPFPVISVGAFCADVYKDPELNNKYMSREVFCEKHKIDINKKTILILSAWGFIDASPDLHIDDQVYATKDKDGREKWLEMIKRVYQDLGKEFNIVVTLHPNVDVVPYKAILDPLSIPIDHDASAVNLVKNSDLVIHAGSTTAIGSHILNVATLQYGDQNVQKGDWWSRSEAVISQVSPYCKSLDELVAMIKEKIGQGTTADSKAIDALEKGRYGSFDGYAIDRTAEIINKQEGKFKFFWPDLDRDYNQLLLKKRPDDFFDMAHCGICGRDFVMAKPKFIEQIATFLKIGVESFAPVYETACPWCASRFYRAEYAVWKKELK